MKVFISWSGDASRECGEIVRRWLPTVIQTIEPYFSHEDVGKGTRWNEEIGRELEVCDVGILCLTRDALDAPWLIFEAGALSKKLGTARVCPILFGVQQTDVTGPLQSFQCCQFEHGPIRKLVGELNSIQKQQGEKAVALETVNACFENSWQKFRADVEGVMESFVGKTNEAVRKDRDVLDEILRVTRGLSQRFSMSTLDQNLLHSTIDSFDALVESLPVLGCRGAIRSAILEHHKNLAKWVETYSKDPLKGGPVRQAYKKLCSSMEYFEMMSVEPLPESEDDIPF